MLLTLTDTSNKSVCCCLIFSSLSTTHLQCEDDADSGEQEGEECPGVEPGDGAGLDGDARVFEVVGHVACNSVYILLEAGLGTLKILPN